MPEYVPLSEAGDRAKLKGDMRMVSGELASMCEHLAFELWRRGINGNAEALGTAARKARAMLLPAFWGERDPRQAIRNLRRIFAPDPADVDSPDDIDPLRFPAITALLRETDAFYKTGLEEYYCQLPARVKNPDCLAHYPILACLVLANVATSPRPPFLKGDTQIIPDVRGDHLQFDAVSIPRSAGLTPPVAMRDVLDAGRRWNAIEIKVPFGQEQIYGTSKLTAPATLHLAQLYSGLARAALVGISHEPEAAHPLPTSIYLCYLRPFSPPVYHWIPINSTRLRHWLTNPSGLGLQQVSEWAEPLLDQEQMEKMRELAIFLDARAAAAEKGKKTNSGWQKRNLGVLAKQIASGRLKQGKLPLT